MLSGEYDPGTGIPASGLDGGLESELSGGSSAWYSSEKQDNLPLT